MKNNLFKRFVSLMICLTMVLAYLPASLMIRADAAASSSGIIADKTISDSFTLHAWKDTSFNPTNLTTEHAGGVWTDKSVLQQGDIATALPGVSGLAVADNNFLVALSALGANSVVAGQGSTPTDTIFVLDVSNSMEYTDLREMVNSTNDAIHSLLTSNDENRIGVVVYGTEVNVLLALDRYTPVQKGYGSNRTNAYIEMTENYGQIRTARTSSVSGATYVKNSDGDNVFTSISASGATFIQGGLWQAYQMFDRASGTDARTPVLVLMSDGAPTYGSENYNAVSSRDVGGGGTSSVTDGLAFLTQLTAAYVKEKIADKYSTDAYFYTVGLGVSESYGVSIAEAVLDTSQTRTDPELWWNTYLGLANQQNQTMSFRAAGENVTIAYDETITADSKDYTDRYFPANDASNLSSAFQGIVNEINLKASYNVTRIEGTDANSSGYVTFADEIGTGMEVKNIKGILVGDTLYTGQRLAQALLNQEFGTADAPTTLGDNMVWALKQRLGITETATVHDLIQQAYDAGQIAYDNQTGAFSNYICWFSDENGDYLGFWDYDDPNCAIPENAVYANASYGMLGTTTDSQTAHASDMMYVAVNVSKEVTQVNGQPALEINTPELVTFRVPASLLPTITYQIEVDAASDEEITNQTPATITYNEAEPIRLLYEVGVHRALTPENIQDFLRPNYQAKDADGNYYLYTNAWYWDGADAQDWNIPENHPDKGDAVLYDTSKNHITYAYFEPSADNEHYYYTDNSSLYIKNGESYEKLTSAPVTDGSVTYYTQHKTYISTTSATQTGVAVEAEIDIHYNEVSAKLLTVSDNYTQDESTGVYYVKKGTMRYSTIHDHDQLKNPNETGSFKYRLHQLVDIAVDGQARESHHFEIAYLGNNGRISYSPAQGFTLSKVMAGNATATGSFTFDVTLSGDTDGKYTETVNGVSTEKALVNNAFTVALAAGEQVTITGIDVGATYTVTEQQREGYTLGGIVVSAGSTNVAAASATGTVEENLIHSITYTNDLQQYGSLLVTKDVTYNKGTQPQAVNHSFQITVELTDLANKQVYVNDVPTILDQSGRTVLNLKDGEQALITGIPEGTAYTVTEELTEGTNDIPYGYTADSGYAVTEGTASGEILKDQVATATVKNTYTPKDIVLTGTEPQISIDITKNFYLYNGGYLFNQSRSFSFELLKYNETTQEWDPVEANGVAITADTTFTNPDTNEDPTLGTNTKTGIQLNMAGVPLDSAGNHYFRVAEVIPEETAQQAGMTYDRTFHDFVIVVTDEKLDGQLEISQVRSLQHANVAGPTDEDSDGTAEHWKVSTEFNNSEITHSTKLTIAAKKTLTGAALKDGQFDFVLYKTGADFVIPANATAFPVKNGANGDIVFTTETYPFASSDTYYYYVMQETSTNGNGIVVDDTIYEIRVKVSPDDNNAVIAEIVWREKGETSYNQLTTVPENNIFNSITFTNSYTAASTTPVNFGGNKTLTNLTPGIDASSKNMSVPANTYEFKLEAITANAPMPAVTEVYAAAGGAIRFGDIIYTAAGVYEYKLTENDTSAAGVTKDSTVYTVKVDVTDNGLGQLVADITYWNNSVQVSEITFNNTYTADPVTGLKIHATKQLDVETGFERPLNAYDFRATLTHPDGKTETVYNDANGLFLFAPLSFDAVGEYSYSISEVIPNAAVNNKFNGIAYDVVRKDFTIVVEDNGTGQLTAKLLGQALSSTSQSVATITNTYSADPVSIHLTAHKDLIGRDLNAEEFSFKLEAITANAPMPNASVIKNDVYGVVDFGSIAYNAIGVYQYKVTEQKLDKNGTALTAGPNGEYVHNGITYSTMVYTVTVTVTDLHNGKLSAQIASVDQTNSSQPGGIVFTNTYTAAPVEASITAQKELYDLTGGGNQQLTVPANTYQFKLEAVENAPMPANSTVYAAQGGAIDFGEITYTDAGVYRYTLTEVDLNKGGVDYDDTVYTVEVTVKDSLQGSLKVESIRYIKEQTGYSEAVFTNKYAAEAIGAQLIANKILTNLTPGIDESSRNMPVPANTYKFKLEAIGNAPTPLNCEVFADAGGVVSFEEITYITAGTYNYSISEIDMQVSGVDTDNTVYTATVVIADDGNGKLYVAGISYAIGQTPATTATFKNSYTADSVQIHVEGDAAATNGKIFTDESSLPENKKDLDDYAFRFTLVALTTGAPMPAVTTVSDNGAGFSFDALTFDTVGVYQYQIFERVDNFSGIRYDFSTYRVTVTVSDIGVGQLQATVEYEKASSGESNNYVDAESIQFNNTYKAKETAVSFSGTKTLTGGRKLKADDFSFQLKDSSGTVIDTAKNDADGNFSFRAIPFTKEGTYIYQLTEQNDGVAGITYDTTVYTLTVTVKDVNSQLQASTTITKGAEAANAAGFTNIFTPEAAVVTVSVNKELVNKSGREIGLDGFQFQLERDGWKQTFTTDSNGKAELPVTFTSADAGKTYTFKLSEVAGDVKNMAYDQTVYEIVVRITQTEDGQLHAAVEREGTGAFKFVNTYTGLPENPKTGDGMNLGLTMALMLSSVACMFVLILSRKHFAD